MDRSPEGAEVEVEAVAGNRNQLGEGIEPLILICRCMRDTQLDKVEIYNGQDGKIELRQHYAPCTTHKLSLQSGFYERNNIPSRNQSSAPET